MKKLVFACIFLSCTSLIKAQQLQVKPIDSLAKLIDKEIQYQVSSWIVINSKLNVNESLAFNQPKFEFQDYSTVLMHSYPQIAVMEGNSKMPVVKFDGLSKMPIARFETFDNTLLKKQKLLMCY